MILVGISIAMTGTSVAQYLTTDWKGWQKDSPVHILANNKSVTHYINGALLFNSSKHDIVEIRLGWALLGTSSGYEQAPVTLGTVEGESVKVDLPAGATAAILTQEGSELSAMLNLVDRSARYEEYLVQIGTVEAKTATGTVFRYDLRATGFFQREWDSAVDALARRAAKPNLIEKFSQDSEIRAQKYLSLARKSPSTTPYIKRVALPVKASAMPFQMYFSCGSSENAIYCTNNVSSCTTSVCGSPETCPKQKCDLMKSIQ